MKRLIALLIALLLLAPAALAGGGSNENNILYAVVHNPDPADRLNLRTKPDTGAISLGKFYNGTPVKIRDIQGDWAYVILFDDFEGWMHTDYLAIGEEAERVESAMPIVTITAPLGKTVVNSMLDSPSDSVLFHLGMRLEVMGVMEDWLFVRSGESITGFTTNDGTTPRVYFSTPDATPPARVPILPTPTPSPTPAPSAYAEYAYAPVEGGRHVNENDWIIFASINEPTAFYGDKAMNNPIGMLQRGRLVRVFNSIDSYATLVMDDRIAGYIPSAQNFTIHTAVWPFHVDQPSAAVVNPIPSDRLHLRESPDMNARSFGRYYNGTIVTLLDNYNGRNEWTHVDIGGVQGYMMSEYLDFSPNMSEVFSALHIYEIQNPTTGDLHLRENPDTASTSLGLYKNGTLVTVIGVTGDWVHVICEGRTGFMLHKHLRTAIGTTFDPY